MNVRLIYNPTAGITSFKNNLDYIIMRFQERGYQVIPYRTKSSKDAFQAAANLRPDKYEMVIVAGGDGTIHQVINGLMQNDVIIPLGIIPVGTANDLAAYLGLPRTLPEACDVLLEGKAVYFDFGQANEKYFINIASAGLLADVSQKIDVHLKNNLGRLAYYLKGLEQVPHFKPIQIDLKSDQKNFVGEVYLFLIMNGRSAGGFTRVAPLADMNDGFLEVILFKPCSLGELVSLFIKVVKGEHLNSPYIEYFRANRLTINCSEKLLTDLDGEEGPAFPLEIKCLSQKIKIIKT